MRARLLSAFAQINASYWFYPALFAIIAFVMALVTIHLDRAFAAELISSRDYLVPARPDGASTMLQVIAATTIGVAATVFSITIAAVAYASGTYGPRLLTNFMENRGNQLALATFIGTFVYAIMVLRTVRAEDEAPATTAGAVATALPGFVPQLSLVVATGLMLVSIAVLVYFLNHIPASIRINTVLEQIGQRLLRQIADRFPKSGSGAEQIADARQGAPVAAEVAGYVEIIDYEGLQDIACREDVVIILATEAGDFLHPPMPLVHVCGPPLDTQSADDVRNCFALSGLRTPTQDLRFLLDELVEIALRALSPGINDPFTAMTALHWIGAATAQLGGRVLRQEGGGLARDEAVPRVIPLMMDFAGYVAAGFGASRSAVATSRKAALTMYDALENAARALNSRDRVEVLLSEGHALMAQTKDSLTGPDLVEVRARYLGFCQALTNG
ncbi:DUF2254 domain-containing protein [Croceicoccus sp. F390]|uniref:DUF2254 domain-containing protein n=1 Tax=Croceicoccus esteveae TaxID=3075597 RepID=A0ABU2ZGQ2_9SPHN|nr:DUF2254 domain-containing protein [Croceicoccus sp. F390]MDT0575770.1 DUF2254 domain-containing protein [Croceicoccus sp. F390]